jgi:hypothetical protein
MSDEQEQKTWSSEFKTLGAVEVRRQVAARHWPKEKLAAARYWLQLEDVRAWQPPASTGTRQAWDFRKWAKYLVAAFFLLVATLRLMRLMRHGV